MATENAGKEVHEAQGKGKIHMTLKGFRDVLRAMRLNLTYQDMVKFTASSQPSTSSK